MALFGSGKENQQIIELQNQILELQKQVHPDFQTLENLKQESILYTQKIESQKNAYSKNAETYKTQPQ